MVLVHMGMTRGSPDVPAGALDPWRQQIKTLAAMDNILAVKVSGTASVVGREWLGAEVRPFLTHLIETFSPHRSMYASDWPASSFAHEYGDWIDLGDEVMVGSSDEEKRSLYRDTAMRVFRLGL